MQGDRERLVLEKELAQAKKEAAALLKKHKLAMQENEVLAAEREVLSRAVGHKGLPEEAQLMNRVIESARRDFASKQELYEKESVRLKKNVTRREKMIDKLQERLQTTIGERQGWKKCAHGARFQAVRRPRY